ncbi:SusD family protein [compost metagenome]
MFFRAHAFYSIAELFAPVYNKLTADGELGIPFRLKADMNEKSERSTLEQTYQQILSDLKDAALLLPQTDSYKTRPVKAAALGLLARVYLSMSDYENALKVADVALKLNTTLLDYNTLDLIGYNPFLPFNEEMVFYAQLSYNEALYSGYFNVDSALIDLYQPDDLRLKAFFLKRSNGTYSYMGSYSPQYLFGGIANDELLLIRAECYARKEEVNLAMDDLNYLLKNRIERQSFVPLSAQSKEEALAAVLKERRKELVYRGLRWTDLRRLNLEPDKAVTLRRKVAGVSYELPPNDKRYVYPIPEDVLKSSGMSQNER